MTYTFLSHARANVAEGGCLQGGKHSLEHRASRTRKDYTARQDSREVIGWPKPLLGCSQYRVK